MTQDCQFLTADFYLINFFLHGLKLNFHQVTVLLQFLLVFIFSEINHKKYQICNTESESHKFNDCFVSGIQQTGEFGRCIIKNIINKRQESDDTQFPGIFCKNGTGGTKTYL